MSMASSSLHHRRKDSRGLSTEDAESFLDSDDPVSSIIQLPQVKSEAALDHRNLGLAPPPLPPKPAFVRKNLNPGIGPAPPPLPPKPEHVRKGSGSTVPSSGALPSLAPRAGHIRGSSSPLPPSAFGPPPLPPKPEHVRSGSGPAGFAGPGPPPLPPKPDAARAEKLVDLSLKPKNRATSPGLLLDSAEQLDPTKLPDFTPPPSRPVPPTPRLDRKPSYCDDASWGASFLDERSQVDPPQPPEPTIISDGDPMRSSMGQVENSTHSLSDQNPSLSLTLPLPTPPYTAGSHRLSLAFPPVAAAGTEETDLSNDFLSLSEENAEDSRVGAIVLSRERLEDRLPIQPPRKAPIQWQLYSRQAPGGETWSVLREYLTNLTLKTHGRNRALQLLTGYVVSACLEGTEAGFGLLSDIVRRMRGAERSERDGSIFTILINITAHASFVQKSSWSLVEEVALRVFSNVIEDMHGRQDDDVMWERALRCFLVLLKASDHYPSHEISSECLAALALHVGGLTHADVDHVIITKGICPRLQSPLDEKISSAGVDFGCLSQIGGIRTVISLFADTSSLSARHALFRIIYDIAVLECLQDVPDHDIDVLRDHVVTFRALLEVYEMADCFVHVFRVGPWPDFVMDCVRVLLFDPLTGDSLSSLAGEAPSEVRKENTFIPHDTGAQWAADETLLHDAVRVPYRSPASRHLFSIRALLKMLDKPFCLKVLCQLEKMARQQADALSQRESMHFAKEWKVLSEIERHVQHFLLQREGTGGGCVQEIVTKIHIAVVDITSGRSSLRSLLQMAEMVVEFFTVKPPFSRPRNLTTPIADSTTKLFLKGELLVAKALLDEADPSIFTLLLLATQTKSATRRLSQCRQCLAEFLGYSKERAAHLTSFTEDYDSAVAYRVSELISKYS